MNKPFVHTPVTDLSIGKIITTEQGRDAIHIAVAPMVAAYQLAPGQNVGIGIDGKAGISMPLIGIVDPYLRGPVNPGEKFWLFLYPNSVTSLRHVWVHPAFGDAAPQLPAGDKAASEKFLREYAKRFYTTDGYFDNDEEAYLTLLSDLREGTLTYRGVNMHGRDDLEDEAELQEHASIVLGKQIDFDKFEYFSCTC